MPTGDWEWGQSNSFPPMISQTVSYYGSAVPMWTARTFLTSGTGGFDAPMNVPNPVIRTFSFERSSVRANGNTGSRTYIRVECREANFSVIINGVGRNSSRLFTLDDWDHVARELEHAYDLKLPDTYADIRSFVGDLLPAADETVERKSHKAPSATRRNKRNVED